MTTLPSLSTLFLLCSFSRIHAHVVLVHPTPRTDNDYLFTFDDGVCNPATTCAAFCGDAYDSSANPVTILPVDVPTTLRWKTNVVHEPLQYRLSLNPAATDEQFDLGDHILTTVTHGEAADPSNVGMTGSFSTTVTIPESALNTCSQAGGDEPCVLQLWDVYYFVSCANVLLTTDEVEEVDPPAPTTVSLPPLPEKFIDTLLFQGASFEDYRVTVEMEEPELDPILYLERCRDYTFVIDAPGHPFVIKTQPGLGLGNVLAIDDPDYSVGSNFPSEGIEGGRFMFRAGEGAPSKGLFYQCTLHEEMFSEIIFVDGGACNGAPDEENDEAGATTSATFTVARFYGVLDLVAVLVAATMAMLH